MTFVWDIEPFSKRVTTVTTLIVALAFWLQFKRTERLNQSTYIMNLNNQFVNNSDMTLVEHVLELYYNEYVLKTKNDNSNTTDVSSIKLRLNLSLKSEDRQKLINYLVYLEALAAIVERNVLHIDVIDNLFSYRFFIAVNNPIVQEMELIPYEQYYKGIFSLSREWTTRYKEKNFLYRCKNSIFAI